MRIMKDIFVLLMPSSTTTSVFAVKKARLAP